MIFLIAIVIQLLFLSDVWFFDSTLWFQDSPKWTYRNFGKIFSLTVFTPVNIWILFLIFYSLYIFGVYFYTKFISVGWYFSWKSSEVGIWKNTITLIIENIINFFWTIVNVITDNCRIIIFFIRIYFLITIGFIVYFWMFLPEAYHLRFVTFGFNGHYALSQLYFNVFFSFLSAVILIFYIFYISRFFKISDMQNTNDIIYSNTSL